MPIQEQNIVFVESQVMDDVPEGGGAATGSVIVDGQMNNVFEDISDLDRAYGRFSLRKIFLAVRTLSTDLYGGAKTVITALPQDDALGYTLFSSNDPFDTRQQAANKVEAYLYKGPTWGGYLFENHIAGMRAISVIQRVDSRLPTVGKTLCIVQDEGVAGEKEQYVRVTKVDVVEQQFADVAYQSGNVEFARWIVTMQLSDALRHNFTGHSPRYADNNYSYTGRARIRDTTVADAARYYGAQRTTAAANIGDLQIRAASQFTKLVPSAQTETPLVNMALNPSANFTLSAGTRTVEVVQQAHTLSRDVTPENRRLSWIETLQPIPAPGSLSVSFLAQGNWYELRDDGTGNIGSSEASAGAGTINYTTGSMSVTLGALPDSGSAVMMVWGSPIHFEVRAGATSDADGALEVRYTLAHAPVIADSLVVTFNVSGAARTATTSAAGAIAGTGVTGTLNPVTGDVVLRFTAAPDRTTPISNTYTWREGDELVAEVLSAPVVGGQVDLSSYAPILGAGSCRISFANGMLGDGVFASDGLLYLIAGSAQLAAYLKYQWLTQVIGSYNPTTGIVTITNPATVDTRRFVLTPAVGSLYGNWSGSAESIAVAALGDIRLERDTDAFNPNAVTGEEIALGASPGTALSFALSASTDAIVANSVRFSMGAQIYEDRSGTLYTNIDPVTGSGLAAGSINYATGRAEITFWNNGATVPTVSSCLTVYGEWTAVESSFRTVQAPIKPEALSITASTAGDDGSSELVTGSTDPDGVIVGAKMRGQINYETGTAFVEFGETVEGEWVPLVVQPATIRYNAVAYSYLPLDADILGIDPVRLPSDGRVPIYRPGDVVMVMHPAETAPAVVTNGGTIDCGRTRIGWIRVIDATGASKPTGFTLDRATGIVTFADVSDMVMPIRVRHTVGDLRQITDAQITGQLTLARPLTHNYPAGESVVASCLIHGDRRARVSAVWDQATWNGTWSDSLVGSEATATLDTIAHPIEVTNEGAETERWLLRWTSTTNVELIGERRGLVYSGPFTADIAPINPRTRAADGTGGVPYLHIPLAANGGGWSTGNAVRINTVGALADIWIARSIQQSDEPLGDGADGVELYALGNIDRP